MKLFSRKAPDTVSLAGPTLGDEDAARLRAQLARGDVEAAHQFLEPVRDWDDRQFFVEAITDQVPGRPPWVDAWVRAHPDSATAHLVRGAQGIHWAWEARGSGMAETVKEDSWKVFWQRLQDAEQDLLRAAELEPADPVPWAYLVISARGLELGLPERTERLKQAHVRHPWHHFAFSQAVGSVAKKWGGSHELMFDVARQALNGAPEGNGVHAVITEAHVERWLYMVGWDKDQANALTYFQTPTVAEEIRLAAQRSVLSPKYQRTRQSPYEHNSFTYCFFRMHDWEPARIELKAMGGTLARYPWAFAGDPVEIFKKISKRIDQGK